MSVITKKLGEIGTYINGCAFKPEDWKTSGLPIIRIENLNNPKAAYNYYQGEFEEKYKVTNGDILVSWSASLDAYVWNNGEAILNQHIFKVIPNDEIVDKDFLFYILKKAIRGLTELVHGATMKHVNKPVFENFEVFFPEDKDMQKVWAKNLYTILDEIEKAREATEIIRRDIEFLKKRIRQSVFEELLERYDRSSLLKEVCNISAGGTPSRGNSAFFSGHIPWVKTLDLNFGLVTDTQEKITYAAFKSIRGAFLPKGTVLVAMYGGAGTIGKSGILGIEACTNQAIAAMVPNQEFLTSDFLHEWICFIRPEWMQYSSGNRKDPNINKAVVENMTMPLPSLQEQNLITNSIKDAYNQAIILEQAVKNQHLEITSMASKILTEAFNEIEND